MKISMQGERIKKVAKCPKHYGRHRSSGSYITTTQFLNYRPDQTYPPPHTPDLTLANECLETPKKLNVTALQFLETIQSNLQST